MSATAYPRDRSWWNSRPSGQPTKMHRRRQPESTDDTAWCSRRIVLIVDAGEPLAGVPEILRCRRCWPT